MLCNPLFFFLLELFILFICAMGPRWICSPSIVLWRALHSQDQHLLVIPGLKDFHLASSWWNQFPYKIRILWNLLQFFMACKCSCSPRLLVEATDVQINHRSPSESISESIVHPFQFPPEIITEPQYLEWIQFHLWTIPSVPAARTNQKMTYQLHWNFWLLYCYILLKSVFTLCLNSTWRKEWATKLINKQTNK